MCRNNFRSSNKKYYTIGGKISGEEFYKLAQEGKEYFTSTEEIHYFKNNDLNN